MTADHTCGHCHDDSCASQGRRPNESQKDFEDRQALAARLCRIQHKLMVLSGKGGVGKSTVAVNLAAALALAGKRVGLLDVDIHGPSVPQMLGLQPGAMANLGNFLVPARLAMGAGSLHVVSIGLMFQNRDEAVIWRGPMKYGVIRQFLKDVEWGDLDYLVIDAPPGTGDEPLTIAQLVEHADGALVVTTPQEVAIQDVRRCITFCRQMELPVLGVIENMSGFVCPHCQERVNIFGSGGGKAMADQMQVPFLAELPMEAEVVSSGDSGEPMVKLHPHSLTAQAINRVVQALLEKNTTTVAGS